MKLKGVNIGFAITGSFCTFDKIKSELIKLKQEEANIIPIFSFHAATMDTRFGKAEYFKKEIQEICQNPLVLSIEAAEPLGPKGMLDLLVIAPCTGNTIGKLANGITDTPVLMAAKAHMRNNKPLVISISTNDALGLNLKNIGTLMTAREVYFVPLEQDNFMEKPKSIVADTKQLIPTLELAMEGRQIQPILKK